MGDITLVDKSVDVVGKNHITVTSKLSVPVAKEGVADARGVIVITRTYKMGASQEDGTIFAGISPDTNGPMFAMAEDVEALTFNDAQERAARLNLQKAYDHDDWRVPTGKELHVIFNNRAAIKGLDLSGSLVSGWYWSSTEYSANVGEVERMSDGRKSVRIKDFQCPVRLVRG